MSKIIITEQDYEKISDDYKGVFLDLQGAHPELKGKRTMITLDKVSGATVLVVEGRGLEIVN